MSYDQLDKSQRILKVRDARRAKQQHKMSWVADRKEERAARTPQQQINYLDYLHGEKGKGAKKERARLTKQLEKA